MHDPSFNKNITRHLRALRRQIGHNIHTARVERGINLEKLARRSGLGAARIDMIELGKGEVELHHVVRLAGALHVEAGDLLNFDENE